MKLQTHCFNTRHGKVIRDKKGRFFLCGVDGKCKELEREEAREHLQRTKGKDNQLAYAAVGEQWSNHVQFFDLGKAFIRIGHNELARNWKNVFQTQQLQSLPAISYNFLHGIELGLKAFLLHIDKRILPIDFKSKGGHGHDIVRLLKDAAGRGLVQERPIVIRSEDANEDKKGSVGKEAQKNWMEGIFGKASRLHEAKFDETIGIEFERYKLKGMEYPISILVNHAEAPLASIAGLAYTLLQKIRDTDDFFDRRRRKRHTEFEDWLEELHAERRIWLPTLEEAAKLLSITYLED
ncbi:MAG: hypothetical protein OXC69_08230 [Candidatus Tectomicrobia bacterium]|nr:hypothetical protein [Candidatus Tectomicrobia bacterium]